MALSGEMKSRNVNFIEVSQLHAADMNRGGEMSCGFGKSCAYSRLDGQLTLSAMFLHFFVFFDNKGLSSFNTRVSFFRVTIPPLSLLMFVEKFDNIRCNIK